MYETIQNNDFVNTNDSISLKITDDIEWSPRNSVGDVFFCKLGSFSGFSWRCGFTSIGVLVCFSTTILILTCGLWSPVACAMVVWTAWKAIQVVRRLTMLPAHKFIILKSSKECGLFHAITQVITITNSAGHGILPFKVRGDII